MFKWIRKHFGYRWSAYFIQNDYDLYYIMHHDSVPVLVDCLGEIFRQCGNPVPPWRIVLNFNHTHQVVTLCASDFNPSGQPTNDLLERIYIVDPDWIKVPDGGPVLPLMYDARTSREINMNKVFDVVFGKV